MHILSQDNKIEKDSFNKCIPFLHAKNNNKNSMIETLNL